MIHTKGKCIEYEHPCFHSSLFLNSAITYCIHVYRMPLHKHLPVSFRHCILRKDKEGDRLFVWFDIVGSYEFIIILVFERRRGGNLDTFGSDEDEAVRSIDVNWIGNI